MTTHWVHRRATLDKERLDAQRREFAKTLGSVITSGLGPIYFGCYFFHSKSHVDFNSFRRKRVSGSMIPSLTSLQLPLLDEERQGLDDRYESGAGAAASTAGFGYYLRSDR